jgi:DNA polymerase kappa
MSTLPIRKINGVGRVTEHMLHALGVQTCQDVLDQSPLLSLVLTEKSFRFLLRCSLGIGESSLSEYVYWREP